MLMCLKRRYLIDMQSDQPPGRGEHTQPISLTVREQAASAALVFFFLLQF